MQQIHDLSVGSCERSDISREILGYIEARPESELVAQQTQRVRASRLQGALPSGFRKTETDEVCMLRARSSEIIATLQRDKIAAQEACVVELVSKAMKDPDERKILEAVIAYQIQGEAEAQLNNENRGWLMRLFHMHHRPRHLKAADIPGLFPADQPFQIDSKLYALLASRILIQEPWRGGVLMSPNARKLLESALLKEKPPQGDD